MNPDLRELSKRVCATASAAFAASESPTGVSRKGDGSLVSDLDRQLQDRLIKTISDVWPRMRVLGEEMPADLQREMASSGNYIALDPLDGTTNFIHGIPFFAVSLAWVEAGVTRFAVTYDPLRDECFAAERGAGAWLGDKPLRLPVESRPLADSVAVVDGKRLPRRVATGLASARPFRSSRNFGSVALEWAWLAAGRYQAYVHGSQKLWDRLPGELLLSESRGSWCSAFTIDAPHAADDPVAGQGRVAADCERTLDELNALLADF